MGKRVRITNSRLNSYGFRVLTEGIDLDQFTRNPVLLYMHERGRVIGYVKDLKVESDEVTGELVFDEATELSQTCKKQWDFGSLKMVSAGLDIVELSEDPKYLVPGQTRQTVTKCKLTEVSVVDIGANDDAIVLHKDGKLITLSSDGDCQLPLLNHSTNQNKQEMDNKTIALALGMPGTATEAEITARLAELRATEEQNTALRAENEQLTLATITTQVNTAIAERRLTEANREQFIELGKEIGTEKLAATLNAMAPQVKLTEVLGHQGGAPVGNQTGNKYERLHDVPADQVVELRKNNPKEYARLYKAEYGMEPEY